MKKITWALVGAMVLGLAACGGADHSAPDEAESVPHIESVKAPVVDAESTTTSGVVWSEAPQSTLPESLPGGAEENQPGVDGSLPEDGAGVLPGEDEITAGDSTLVLPLVEAMLLDTAERFTWLSEAAVKTHRTLGYRAFTVPYTLDGYEGVLMAQFTTWSEIELVAETALSNGLAFQAFAVPEESFMEAVGAFEALGVASWFSENDWPAGGAPRAGEEYYRYGSFEYEGHTFGAFVKLATKGWVGLADQLADDEWPVLSIEVELQDDWPDIPVDGK